MAGPNEREFRKNTKIVNNGAEFQAGLAAAQELDRMGHDPSKARPAGANLSLQQQNNNSAETCSFLYCCFGSIGVSLYYALKIPVGTVFCCSCFGNCGGTPCEDVQDCMGHLRDTADESGYTWCC